MRILFMSAALPMAWGSEARAYRFLEYLTSHHEVDLVCFHAWPGARPSREAQAALIAGLAARCRRLTQVPLPRSLACGNCVCNAISEEPFQIAYHRSEGMRRAVRDQFATERYDLVWINGLPMSQYAADLPAPTVLDAGGCAALRYHRLSRLPAPLPQRQFYRGEAGRTLAYEARMLPRFTRCLVGSAAERDDLWQLAPEASILVIPNTIELTRHLLPSRATRPCLAFVGDLHHPAQRHAADYLCRRVLPRVRRVMPNAEALIIGPGRSSLRAGLSRLPGVRATGHLTSFDAPLSEARVVVCPLRADVGFPVHVVEAMACGRPVIASPLVMDALGLRADDPILVADSAAEYAHQATALLRHPHVADSLGGRGRRLVLERFDLKSVGARLDAILQQLVPRSRSRRMAAQ